MTGVAIAALVSMSACVGLVQDKVAGPPHDEPSTVMAEMAAAVPIGGDAILIAESDFLAALQASGRTQVSEMSSREGVRAAALSNTPSALGVFGKLSEKDGSFSGDLFVVVRDPDRGARDGYVEARDFYLAGVTLSGRAAWVVSNPHIALVDDLPLPSRGRCTMPQGPSLPRPCPGPTCLPMGFSTAFDERLDAPPGQSVDGRISMRLYHEGNVFDWVCVSLDPGSRETPVKPVPGGPTVLGEACNGLDDNGNGQIDEGDVCASTNTSCVPIPAIAASDVPVQIRPSQPAGVRRGPHEEVSQ
ncbi:hypothetical protein [Caldimonas brevitalea]|uniref:EF-hand domain-containing protein n=1 Tax=Caldimonas brevitalea TaxID=413882 RepID=A0A0G3BMQ8_9BURK|nr:hypothetical protein [Caldimonas brevitalea]AKJ30754.1 hypothetical protein AAW51_4063 [Caldimonas brevitalea]